AAGIHNSGVALVEVTRNGPRLLFNNEEERFSAVKHTNKYPQMAIAALRAPMAGMGLDIKNIDAWFSSWDYAALAATLIRSLLEELSVNIGMTKGDPTADRHPAPRQSRLVLVRDIAVRAGCGA